MYVLKVEVQFCLWLIEQGLTSHQHITGHIRDDFYRSYDQTNSVTALQEASWSFR